MSSFCSVHVNGPSGELCRVQADQSWTARDLKVAIEQSSGVSCREQQLFFANAELQDDSMLDAVDSVLADSAGSAAEPASAHRVIHILLLRRQPVPWGPEARSLPPTLSKNIAHAELFPFLDPQLVIEILGSSEVQQGFCKTEEERAAHRRLQIAFIAETRMIDLQIEKYGLIGEAAPQSLLDRRPGVLETLQERQRQLLPLLHVLEDEDQLNKCNKCSSVSEACQVWKVDAQMVEDLVMYAHLLFDTGNYPVSREVLRHYRSIMDLEGKEHVTRSRCSCNWGELAISLLIGVNEKKSPDYDNMSQEYENERAVLRIENHLRDATMATQDVLLHRTWLLHWTLFAVFELPPECSIFDPEEGDVLETPPAVVEVFLQDESLSTMSASCPHLFRYVSACLVIREFLWPRVSAILQTIGHSSSDPITKFLRAVYINPSAEEARTELTKCAQACRGDYFLARHWHEFQENAESILRRQHLTLNNDEDDEEDDDEEEYVDDGSKKAMRADERPANPAPACQRRISQG